MSQTNETHFDGQGTQKEKLIAQEFGIKKQKELLTVEENALRKEKEKLTTKEGALRAKEEKLTAQLATIAHRKKLARLTPREKAIRKQRNELTDEANAVKKLKETLIDKETAIRKEKEALTPEEINIKKEIEGLTAREKEFRKQQARLAGQEKAIARKKQRIPLNAQEKAFKKAQTKLSPRKTLLKKKHGGLHPESVASYIPDPDHPLTIPKQNNKDAYGTLTDKSTYSEYAWAFLRRNRFYQRLIDRALPNLTVETWEYANNSEHETPIGIVYLKPYWEPFAVGSPPKWWGIHTFQDQLERAIPGRQRRQIIELEWPKTQVALVFDIGPLLGDNTSAIDKQLDIAKVHLHTLAKKAGISFPAKRRSLDKKLFRAQLRVADLLSSPKALSKATESSKQSKPHKTSDADKPANTLLTISGIVDLDLLPAFDIKSIAPNKNNDTARRKKMRKRVSALAVGAWNNIYNMRFLKWLQFDNWDHLALSKADEVSAKKAKSTKVATKKGLKPKMQNIKTAMPMISKKNMISGNKRL